MAGRITVIAGAEPIELASLDATNATVAYADLALTQPIPLPFTITAGSAQIFYVADTASITPTIKDQTLAHTIYSLAQPCRAGLPIVIGPLQFTHATTVA